MPLPIHLICSESGAIDETTKLASFFNLIEKLQFAKIEIQPGVAQAINMVSLRLSALWMREEGDLPETVFEVHFVAIVPNAPQEVDLARGTFQFAGPLQRVNVPGVHIIQFYGSGILRLEARIRKAGEESWINRMSYPIIVEETNPPKHATPAAKPS
jgi:hypothetical protein